MLDLINGPTRELPLQKAPAAEPAPGPHLGFRADIEGLRAVAVTLVVLAHAGVGRVEGGYVGVDVFFVISGFLITGLLLGEHRRSGTISLPRFYARRALRLLPVATVVVLATVAAAWFWLPATRFKGITLDALFSTFYGINWRLAAEGIDYMNATADPSPLQHLWSLAVEEQFYLVWPLLLLLTIRSRKVLAGALGALVVLSLGLSIQQTGTAAPWAYFGSHTRAWELGIGALLAVFAVHLGRIPGRGATILSWAGLAAIGVAALTFTEDTPFPGYAALLPVLGAAAVIAGRNSLLGVAPMRWVGKLSYGWYLWHWPVLMIWPAALVRDPSVTLNLLFAAGALLLALGTYHLVENPLRAQPKLRARAYRGLLAGLAFSLLTVGVAAVGGRFTPPLPTGPAAPGVAAELAAAADPQARLTELIKSSTGAFRMPSNLTPSLLEPSAEMPGHYAAQCHLDYRSTKFDTCAYGDPAGDRTVFLIGDSHAAHWFPAVDAAARTEGWRLVALTKSSCQMPTIVNYSGPLKRAYTECARWREAVLARVVAEKPDLVVIASNDSDNGGLIDSTTGGIVSPKGQKDDDLWLAGWKKTWAKLKGFKLMQIQDTVRPTKTAPECLAENAWQIRKCDQVKTKGIVEPHRRQIIAKAAKAQGITVIDPSPWQCAAGVCPPIVGDTLVYRDGNHLSVAYARALTPLVQKAVLGE
ncbi:acyltransferase family protein [Actinoplanes missouriensis]|uniref:acyltransferase family protein n=1 Tax=Actinoplanes missouriensis TaxID=1866 RepID=UPI0034027295